MVADCVFQAAAAVMIWFQTAKRLVISGSPFGRADQMTTGPKVLSDAAERKQEPLGLPRRGEAFHHPFPGPPVGQQHPLPVFRRRFWWHCFLPVLQRWWL